MRKKLSRHSSVQDRWPFCDTVSAEFNGVCCDETPNLSWYLRSIFSLILSIILYRVSPKQLSTNRVMKIQTKPLPFVRLPLILMYSDLPKQYSLSVWNDLRRTARKLCVASITSCILCFLSNTNPSKLLFHILVQSFREAIKKSWKTLPKKLQTWPNPKLLSPK